MPSIQSRAAFQFVKLFLSTRSAQYLPLTAVRRVMNTVAAPAPKTVSVAAYSNGEIRGEWLTPPNAKRDAGLLYLHGGAFCVGSCRSHRGLAASLAKAAGVRSFLLDYRLAPEHPYPAALEDAQKAYDLLREEYGTVVVAGDSAGGGLSLSLALSLKKAGKALPGALVLFSPWSDLTLSGASMETHAARDPMLTKDWLAQMAAHYLNGYAARDPLVSPLLGELRGLPPMLIQVGTEEVLLDDAKRLQEAARAAGVEVVYQEEKGLWHVWQALGDLVPEAARSVTEAGDFFQNVLRRTPRT